MFDSLLNAAVGVALTPVNVARDVINVDDTINDTCNSHTARGLRGVAKDLDDAYEDRPDYW